VITPGNPLSWYDTNASKFCDDTYEVDMSHLHQSFLRHLPKDARILDAGCGSGRDAKIFHDLGYRVTAIDASKEMVRSANKLTGLSIIHMPFSDMKWKSTFDGIWACASLLHVQNSEINGIFSLFANALRPKGVWYMSFVKGTGEREDVSGRHYTDFEPESLSRLLANHPELLIMDIWITSDNRPDHKDKFWTNAIVHRRHR
jgi:2-polyprenyl-3-methyl-5-hydroxy-6-metoxy-1,4-benzoquinol methylase